MQSRSFTLAPVVPPGVRATARHVARVGNLLYRRLAVGNAAKAASACGLPIRDTADCQSALPDLLLVALRSRSAGL